MADTDAMEKSLENLDDDINDLLADKTLSLEELVRGVLRSQRASIPFLSQVATNTKKVDEIYPMYKVSMLVNGSIIVAIVGIIVGLLTHTIKIP